MNSSLRWKSLILSVTILAGIGIAFALPALARAQQLFATINTPPDYENFQEHHSAPLPACPGFPIFVSSESQLNDAIDCYNSLAVPGQHWITLTKNIDLTGSTTTIFIPRAFASAN